MKRRGKGLVGAGVVGLCLLCVPALLWPRPGVTVENFGRLHAGMTMVEARAILGEPALEQGHAIGRWGMWHGDRGQVVILFSDEDGPEVAVIGEFTTEDGASVELRGRSVSFLDRLRRLLRV